MRVYSHSYWLVNFLYNQKQPSVGERWQTFENSWKNTIFNEHPVLVDLVKWLFLSRKWLFRSLCKHLPGGKVWWSLIAAGRYSMEVPVNVLVGFRSRLFSPSSLPPLPFPRPLPSPLKGQCVKFSKFNHRFNGSNGLRIWNFKRFERRIRSQMSKIGCARAVRLRQRAFSPVFALSTIPIYTQVCNIKPDCTSAYFR